MKVCNQLLLLVAIFMFGCNKADNLKQDLLGLWIIESIAPTIHSDPNQPDCRLTIDYIFFNTFDYAQWNRAATNEFGTFSQPCQNQHMMSYNYSTKRGVLRLFDFDTNIEIDWSVTIDDDILSIERADTLTIYRKDL